MNRKIIILIAVALIILALLPIPMAVNDGGTVVYRAILYDVTNLHRILGVSDEGSPSYTDGLIIRILGIEVYNSTE